MKALAGVLINVLLLSGVVVGALGNYCLPSDSCWPTSAVVSIFKNEMLTDGKTTVLVEGDQDWPGKSLTYNQALAKTPGMVVYATTVLHIRRAIQFAKQHNIKISVVSSGHSFLGRCGDEGAMQISVVNMKDIQIDLDCPESPFGCITTQSGVTWGEAFRESNKYGRMVVGGSNPTVSVTGWTIGGGHSPLSRSYGLGVDNVLEFHLITADLSEVWTSANGTKIIAENGTMWETNDTALFYALRGGGSAFGFIIDLKFKLYEDSVISQFTCTYYGVENDTSRTFGVILKSLGELLPTLPNTFSGYILPTVGCDPTSLVCGGTMAASILHRGATSTISKEDREKLTSLPHTWSESGLSLGGCQINEYSSFYEYEMTIPNSTYGVTYIGGSLIQEDLLSISTSDTFVKHYTKAYERSKIDPTYNLIGTATWVGGAVKDIPVDEVPVHPGWRNAIFSFTAGTGWDPVTTDPTDRIQGVREFHEDLARFSSGKYYNEAEFDMAPAQWKKEFWSDSAYEKLVDIKKAWDPQNIFTCNQCIGSDWMRNEPVFG